MPEIVLGGIERGCRACFLGRPSKTFRRIDAIRDADSDPAAGNPLHFLDEVPVQGITGAHHPYRRFAVDGFRRSQIDPAVSTLNAIIGQIADAAKQALNIFGEGRPVAVAEGVVNPKKDLALIVQDLDKIHFDRSYQWQEMLKEAGAIFRDQSRSDPRHLCDPVDQTGGGLLLLGQEQPDLLGVGPGHLDEASLQQIGHGS